MAQKDKVASQGHIAGKWKGRDLSTVNLAAKLVKMLHCLQPLGRTQRVKQIRYKIAGSCRNWGKLAWACSDLNEEVSTWIQSGIQFFSRHTGNPYVMWNSKKCVSQTKPSSNGASLWATILSTSPVVKSLVPGHFLEGLLWLPTSLNTSKTTFIGKFQALMRSWGVSLHSSMPVTQCLAYSRCFRQWKKKRKISSVPLVP